MDRQSNRAEGGARSGEERSATEGAGGMAQQVGHTAEQAADQVRDTAQKLASQAGHTASEVADQARRAAASQADQQKDRVVQGIHSVADALRLGSENLPEREREYASYVTRVADQVDRASSYLERRDVRELSNEVESFARQHPAAFLGGAFALGVLGARFLKSSADEARQENLPAPRRYAPNRYEGTEGGFAQPGGPAAGGPTPGGGYV